MARGRRRSNKPSPFDRPGRRADVAESKETPSFFIPSPGCDNDRKARGHRKSVANNSRSLDALGAFCEAEGLALKVANKMGHYIIRRPIDKPGEHFAQWWPKTAKLVFRCAWDRGVHCHDVTQLIAEIRRELRKGEK